MLIVPLILLVGPEFINIKVNHWILRSQKLPWDYKFIIIFYGCIIVFNTLINNFYHTVCISNNKIKTFNSEFIIMHIIMTFSNKLFMKTDNSNYSMNYDVSQYSITAKITCRYASVNNNISNYNFKNFEHSKFSYS